MFRRQRNPQKECRQHVENAYSALHHAIRELRTAHHYAAEMGDREMSDRLWDYSALLPTVTAPMNDYLERGVRLPRLA